MSTLREKYFSEGSEKIEIPKGEYLLKKGGRNRRLFLLESGELRGVSTEDESSFFPIREGHFIGVNSFFSRSGEVQIEVLATKNSVLCYFEKNIWEDKETGKDILWDFMPMVVHLLTQRQEDARRIDLQNKKVMARLQDVDKLASLGQLSAGVAHELNNAITVISRGSEQVSREIESRLGSSDLEKELLCAGIREGRRVSSLEARREARELTKKSKVDKEMLREYARTGKSEYLLAANDSDAMSAVELWNVGATLHDLNLAAKQSEHVVQSMKSLAQQNVVRQAGCNVIETIDKAMALMRNLLKQVEIERSDAENLPEIVGNQGELVQVWTNIVKNAVEAMQSANLPSMKIQIRTDFHQKKFRVRLRDNGPGIPQHLIKNIFKPHVTTKKDGQTFGLGLGLTIVNKIINSYTGELLVNSNTDKGNSGTQFTVLLPIGEIK